MEELFLLAKNSILSGAYYVLPPLTLQYAVRNFDSYKNDYVFG